MKKHFAVEIGEDTLSWQRRTAAIAAEQALDGLWAVRAKVPEEQLSDEGVVRAYKRLARVERAFRHISRLAAATVPCASRSACAA